MNLTMLPCCLVAVLQAEVSPPLLIKGRRKFHIRTYLVVIEKLGHQDLLDMYIYNQHEVRIAGTPIPDENEDRNPLAHITNGALSNTTERVLLTDVDELMNRQIQAKTEVFVAETFGKHLLPDIVRRINISSTDPDANGSISKFALAGLDIMVTEENHIYLLEVNANPAAPPESTVDAKFKEHLQGFFHELMDLVMGKPPSPSFLLVQDILVREGLIG
jgi:Tubulin-tyrosine ligase family